MNSMKFNIKKGIPPIIHVLFCFVVLVIPLLVMSRNEDFEYRHYAGYFIRTAIVIALFYINYFILIDRFLLKKQVLLYILINILLVAGSVLLQNVLFELWIAPRVPHILPSHPKVRKFGGSPGAPHELRIIGDYILMILAVGMSVALKATIRWYRDSINLETLKAAQLEADLKNLRSQLNPHFLFNTLNNIYSLIAIDTNKAQDSVHRLSHLLRYILYENDANFVPIDKELEFTQNYIDLMRLRLASNVKLDVSIKNDDHNNIKIASLLFITLIENAFKHGINNGSDSFVSVNIFVNKEKGVLCTVENSLSDTKDKIESKNSGIGLANLRKRLELLYPYNHQLVITQKEDRFSVLLSIDFNDNKK